MAASSASERLASGLTLHRPDILDQKGATHASARARGRLEGHQSKPNSIFRPLGHPVQNERIVELHLTKLAKVEQTCAMVVATLGSSQNHHDARAHAHSSGQARPASAVDAQPEARAEPAGGPEAEQVQHERLAKQPHGLFGTELTRCRGSGGHRHASDGFGRLRDSIREAEVRVRQVRADCVGSIRGFDYGGAFLEALLPPRERYPPETAPMLAQAEAAATGETAGGSGPSSTPPPPSRPPVAQKLVPAPPREPRPTVNPRPRAPQSARSAAPGFHHVEHAASWEKRAGRGQTHRLQSLEDFITSAGPVMGVVGRSERGDALRLREQINELLGLDRNVTLKLPPEEAGGRRGRLDIRRRIEKRMDEAWSNRAFLRQCLSVPKDAAERVEKIERTLREEAWAGEAMDEAKVASMGKLATLERYLRDLSALADERAAGADVERTAGVTASSEERDAGAAAWVGEATEGAERRRKRERKEADEAAAKFAAVARLRAALHGYQASREDKRHGLEELLHAMDANRPNLLRRAALVSGGGADTKAAAATPRAEAEANDDHLQRRYNWYRDLLHTVQDDKQHLPRVAHYIFDSVRQVLEAGEDFGRDVFFVMLDRIQNFEFSRVVAGLVVNMIRGIEDVKIQDLVGWFEQNRGEVPPAILELCDGSPPPALLPPTPTSARMHSKTLTFVTELP